jgi:competence protein ComEC
MVPISSLDLACNVASLLCGTWLGWLTELFNHSAWFWMRCMVVLSNWCIGLPNAYYYVRGFSPAGILIYYLLLVGFFSGWLWNLQGRRWRIASLVVGMGFFCIDWYSAHRTIRLTILPSDGSLSVYFHAPSKPGDILVDCGAINAVQSITRPFLRAQGLDHLPALILTHGDIRHTGGAELLVKLFAARQVCVSPVRFRSTVYRRTVERLSRTPNLVRTLASGDQFGSWTVLYPDPSDHFPKADDNALVLQSGCEGTRVLLCSDLGRAGQHALLARRPQLRADIVVAGVPTDGEPLCDGFLDAIQPRIIIIADSEFPRSERATLNLQQRLIKREVPVIYTRSSGAVTIEFRAKGWDLRTMSGQRISSAERRR